METVTAVIDFPPGTVAPWHTHPGAQELLYVIEGGVVVEIKGKESMNLKAGEAGVIPAQIIHLARNANTDVSAKALTVFSRANKNAELFVFVNPHETKFIEELSSRITQEILSRQTPRVEDG